MEKGGFISLKIIFAICLLTLILFSLTSYSQKEYIEKNKNYSVAKIYQKNHKIIKIRDLQIINDTLVTYKAIDSLHNGQLLIDDVKYVSVRNGSNALKYGLIGAGLGFTSIFYSGGAPYVIAYTVGFGLAGAIIGAFNYKWKRLYFQSKDLNTSYFIYPAFDRNSYSLGILINF